MTILMHGKSKDAKLKPDTRTIVGMHLSSESQFFQLFQTRAQLDMRWYERCQLARVASDAVPLGAVGSWALRFVLPCPCRLYKFRGWKLQKPKYHIKTMKVRRKQGPTHGADMKNTRKTPQLGRRSLEEQNWKIWQETSTVIWWPSWIWPMIKKNFS